MKLLLISLLLCILISCVEKDVNQIEILETQTLNKIFITSNEDSDNLVVYFPHTFKIINNLNNDVSVDNFTLIRNNKKNLAYFSNNFGKIDFEIENLETNIKSKTTNKYTIYNGYTILFNEENSKQFEADRKIIKRNCSKENDFKNDTIWINGKDDFFKKYSKKYYNNVILKNNNTLLEINLSNMKNGALETILLDHLIKE